MKGAAKPARFLTSGPVRELCRSASSTARCMRAWECHMPLAHGPHRRPDLPPFEPRAGTMGPSRGSHTPRAQPMQPRGRYYASAEGSVGSGPRKQGHLGGPFARECQVFLRQPNGVRLLRCLPSSLGWGRKKERKREKTIERRVASSTSPPRLELSAAAALFECIYAQVARDPEIATNGPQWESERFPPSGLRTFDSKDGDSPERGRDRRIKGNNERETRKGGTTRRRLLRRRLILALARSRSSFVWYRSAAGLG